MKKKKKTRKRRNKRATKKRREEKDKKTEQIKEIINVYAYMRSAFNIIMIEEI